MQRVISSAAIQRPQVLVKDGRAWAGDTAMRAAVPEGEILQLSLAALVADRASRADG